MEEKEFKKLKVGDKVRIVSEKVGCAWNPSGEMDKWLGKVMTIGDMWVSGNLRMVEDNGNWQWHPHMIDKKVFDSTIKVGSKVKYIGWEGNIHHSWFPSVGTIGKVIKITLVGTVEVQWPKGSTSGDDIWWSNINDLEPVPVNGGPVTIVEHLIKDRKTIVKLSNGKVGVAVCSPEDEFDIYEGLRLATERAYGKAESYKKPAPVKEVNRPAKVGEWIKIVRAYGTDCLYKDGDILKVADREFGNIGVNVLFICADKNLNKYISDREYVVLENYDPKKN